MNKKSFQDVIINVKIKLSALWVVLMFCYTYADILGLCAPGNIKELMAGVILLQTELDKCLQRDNSCAGLSWGTRAI